MEYLEVILFNVASVSKLVIWQMPERDDNFNRFQLFQIFTIAVDNVVCIR